MFIYHRTLSISSNKSPTQTGLRKNVQRSSQLQEWLDPGALTMSQEMSLSLSLSPSFDYAFVHVSSVPSRAFPCLGFPELPAYVPAALHPLVRDCITLPTSVAASHWLSWIHMHILEPMTVVRKMTRMKSPDWLGPGHVSSPGIKGEVSPTPSCTWNRSGEKSPQVSQVLLVNRLGVDAGQQTQHTWHVLTRGSVGLAWNCALVLPSVPHGIPLHLLKTQNPALIGSEDLGVRQN